MGQKIEFAKKKVRLEEQKKEFFNTERIYKLAENIFYNDLGKALKEIRLQRGYRPAQVAEFLYCSESALFNYEAGRRKISVYNLNIIAYLYDIDVEDILTLSKWQTILNHCQKQEVLGKYDQFKRRIFK